jgi:hypothetical protein
MSHIYTTNKRKVQRSSALDIEVEIWFPSSRMTPYHTYGLSMGLSTTDETLVVEMRIWCIKIGNVFALHQALSLSTQERGNLYL